MNDPNDSFSAIIPELCGDISEENGVAMEKKSHMHPLRSSPWKSIYLLDEYYSNPSMAEPDSEEESKEQRLVPFSVEWQMYNA